MNFPLTPKMVSGGWNGAHSAQGRWLCPAFAALCKAGGLGWLPGLSGEFGEKRKDGMPALQKSAGSHPRGISHPEAVVQK